MRTIEQARGDGRKRLGIILLVCQCWQWIGGASGCMILRRRLRLQTGRSICFSEDNILFHRGFRTRIFKLLEQKKVKDTIISHYMIPPITVHGSQEWASVGVTLCRPHTSKDVVVLGFIINNIQIAAYPCSCCPFFQTNISLTTITYSE
jgi:hypothetical protein